MLSQQNSGVLRYGVLRYCVVLALIVPALSCFARKIRLRVDEKAIRTLTSESRGEEISDTVSVTGKDAAEALRLFGYDKPYNSSKESVFVTSRLTKDTIVSITVNIEYLASPSETLLHTRTVRLSCVLPPGQSCRVQFPSWDLTHTFYYYRTPPARTPNRTPYRVRLTPLSLTLSGCKKD